MRPDPADPVPIPAAPLQIAIVGAGPAGLTLALMAARRLPQARIAVYDSLDDDARVAGDARTLALSLGTLQTLRRLGLWADIARHAAPITAVHVSQQQPALLGLLRARAPAGEPAVCLRARDLGVEQLGAVLPYGALAAPLRAAWRAACAADATRLRAHFGVAVDGLRQVAGGVEVDAGIVERHDLAVVAEGGVFADQARKALHHDYRQTAWVGEVRLAGGEAGMACERFTAHGPAALLPLPAAPGLPAGQRRAALVWCVDAGDDPVAGLSDAQRRVLLATIFPDVVGEWVGVAALKPFALGLNAERRLVQGRAVRIGNAAQTLHPVAGQGLNLGLRDAHELVECLARQADVDAALRRFERRRAPDRWTMMATTDFLARSFTWDLPGLTTLRGAGLALVDRLPWLKARLARQMMFGQR